MTVEEALSLAIEHHRGGRLGEAERIYRLVLGQYPNHHNALHLLGVLAHDAGRSDAAVRLIGRAVEIDGGIAAYWSNLGLALAHAGEAGGAVTACWRAVSLEPNLAEAHTNLGIALARQGLFERAIESFQRAIALKPTLSHAPYNLGKALFDTGRLAEAVGAYRRAIALRPNYPAAYNNLGVALLAMGDAPSAAEAHRIAVKLDPRAAEAEYNLGNALRETGQPDPAEAAYRRAIALRPDYPEAHNNLGNALRERGCIDEALGAYRASLAIKPDPGIYSNLLFTMHLHPRYGPRRLLEEHRRWDELFGQRATMRHANEPTAGRRLRIGYVSADLRDHVAGHGLWPLLAARDAERVETFVYCDVSRPDEMTARLRAAADQWRDIDGWPDGRIAEQIVEDRIDVLVDLAVHSARNRLPLFAMKPAPVQVTYLGYCSTTGLAAMDYRLSDPHIDPPDADLSVYSERTERLPRSYWWYEPLGPTPEPAVEPPAKDAGQVTFGCLNQFAKVSVAAIETWAEVLRGVAGSRLLLHTPEGSCRKRVLDTLGRKGIAAERVQFVQRRAWPAYVETYQQIDVALDPFPCNGGITTCDALWMAVPVVSLSGRTSVGRSGRSVLMNLGLGELVAETVEEYVSIAVGLGNDVARLGELRRGLRDRFEASPLRDARGHAAAVEEAYRRMWERWCARDGAGGV